MKASKFLRLKARFQEVSKIVTEAITEVSAVVEVATEVAVEEVRSCRRSQTNYRSYR